MPSDTFQTHASALANPVGSAGGNGVGGVRPTLPGNVTRGFDMKLRRSWVGLLAGGSLVIASCSTGGTASSTTSAATTSAAATSAAATTSSSASSSSAATSGSKSSSSSESSGSESDSSSSEAPPAELDEPTQQWFAAFCTNLADISQYTSPNTAGQSLDQEQATVVTAYTGISTSATKAAEALSPLPPPSITSGTEIAAATTKGFQDLADIYGRGAQTISALNLTSEADLKTAVQAVESEARSAAPNSLGDLDPGVESAVKQLPECASVVGS